MKGILEILIMNEEKLQDEDVYFNENKKAS